MAIDLARAMRESDAQGQLAMPDGIGDALADGQSDAPGFGERVTEWVALVAPDGDAPAPAPVSGNGNGHAPAPAMPDGDAPVRRRRAPDGLLTPEYIERMRVEHPAMLARRNAQVAEHREREREQWDALYAPNHACVICGVGVAAAMRMPDGECPACNAKGLRPAPAPAPDGDAPAMPDGDAQVAPDDALGDALRDALVGDALLGDADGYAQVADGDADAPAPVRKRRGNEHVAFARAQTPAPGNIAGDVRASDVRSLAMWRLLVAGISPVLIADVAGMTRQRVHFLVREYAKRSGLATPYGAVDPWAYGRERGQ